MRLAPEKIATKTPKTTAISEALTLVRCCAEPRLAGESVKAAIRRASQRLDFPFTRTKDLWYGDARRIDAGEMDRLRQEALNTKLRLSLIHI